jgi:hypothetical protein
MWLRSLGLTLALSGCSLMFIPPVNKAKPMDCNPDRTHVAADVAWAGIDFFPALIFFILSVPHNTCVNNDCTHHDGDTKWAGTALIFGGAMITHVISAKVGFSRSRECREAREEAQRQQQPAYPYPYYQQPYPQQPYYYPQQGAPYPQQGAPYPQQGAPSGPAGAGAPPQQPAPMEQPAPAQPPRLY